MFKNKTAISMRVMVCFCAIVALGGGSLVRER